MSKDMDLFFKKRMRWRVFLFTHDGDLHICLKICLKGRFFDIPYCLTRDEAKDLETITGDLKIEPDEHYELSPDFQEIIGGPYELKFIANYYSKELLNFEIAKSFLRGDKEFADELMSWGENKEK